MSDLVHEMASAAARASTGRRRPPRRPRRPVRDAFDGVTCRFGVMFFADPERAESPGGPRWGGVFAVWTA